MDREEQQAILNVLAEAFGPDQAVEIVGKYRLAATIAKQQVAQQEQAPAAVPGPNGKGKPEAVPA